jgi:mono/diheme cytochrome c family protein
MRHLTLCLISLLFLPYNLPAAEPTVGQQLLALVFERQDAEGNTYPHMADPPLWPHGKYLLAGESNQKLHALLDQLTAHDAKTQFPSPREKALVQNALWQVFAYMTLDLAEQREARAALRPKLASAIRQLDLSAAELAALPDNLSASDQSDVPPLLARDSAWIALSLKDDQPVAAAHLEQLHGSAFLVFLKHPQGRAEGLRLLDELAKVPFPLARSESGETFFQLNAIPVQLPDGTQVALLRRMLLMSAGRLVASPITQTLQIRTRDAQLLKQRERMLYQSDMRMQEFHLDRAKYLADAKLSLGAVKSDEREPLVFHAHSHDAYEKEDDRRVQHPLVLQHCAGCHRDPGTASLLSFTRFFSSMAKENPGLHESTVDRETTNIIKATATSPAYEQLLKLWRQP